MSPRILALAAIAVSCCTWAQNRVYVTAPQVRLVSGETMQLNALARNTNGDPISSATFQWSTSDSRIAQVDSSGKVTAASLGLVDITAVYQGVSGILRLQVLPQRIGVSPANISIPFGSQQQFTATAYDVNGQAIPGVTFVWHLGLYSGGDSTTVPMRNGLVTATTLGYFIVRASVVYPNTPEQFQVEFAGSTPVTIVPPGKYAISLLASNADSKPQFALRGRRTSMAAAEDGSLYFSGILDGLSNGLMRVNNGVITPLQLAGGPSFLPGVSIWDFDDPSVDSKGNVVARMSNWSSGSMVVERLADGTFFPIAMDGMRASGRDLSNIFSYRSSLSDSGDVLFRADAREPGSTVSQTGLFRYANGSLLTELLLADGLPGFTGPATSFDNTFGIDASRAIYFIARGPQYAAVYRKELTSPDPVKLLALGDLVNGAPINGIYQSAINRRGDIFVYGSTANGPNYLAVFAGGKLPARFFNNLSYLSTMFDASANGTIVFTGDAFSGYGLYSWNPLQGTSPQPLLLRGRPLPSGEPVFDVYWAAADSSGQVYATVRGVDSPWTMISLKPSPSIIANSGDPVFTDASINVNPNLVPGDKTGPLHVLAGGNQFSVFEAGEQGLRPLAVVNDKLPGGNLVSGTNPVRKSASGTIYLGNDQAVYRLDGSSITQLQAFPVAKDGVNIASPFLLAVNDQQQLAMYSGTNANHLQLNILRPGGEISTIAYFGGSGPYVTPSPGGGNFASLNELAINESGAVMVNVTANGAQGGLFYWNGSSWNTACQLQNCRFENEPVTSISQLKAAGDRFCAAFNNRLNTQSIRCWESGSWKTMLIRGEITSDGTEASSLGAFDVNRKGDVAAVLFTQGLGGPSVFLKSNATGEFVTVHVSLFPMADGTTLRNIYSVDLRDDGRLYFSGMDFFDRLLLYEANPAQ